MNPQELEHVMTELQKYPSALTGAYETARIAVEGSLGPVNTVRWSEDGIRIARQTPRSWEVASEYYRASPRVLQAIGYPQFQRWVEAGIDLCGESPTVAASYFRASPAVLPHIQARQIATWANLGRSLSRGTWKSSSLASRFFETGTELYSTLSFREVELFVHLVESLSARSYDLAAECLHLGQRVLPTIDEREELISLANALVDNSWREVRGTFEAAARISASVERKLRPRYYALTERLARAGMQNVSSFILETTQSLGQLDAQYHPFALQHAEDLVEASAEAVGAFLKSAPAVLQRISLQQMEAWYGEGLKVLKENVDGGVAYFRVESSRAEAVLDQLSSTVEFEKVKPLLTVYANAMAGTEVELQGASAEMHRNHGWVAVESASTDGMHIYLPTIVDRHPTKDENFAWLKVVSTHQTGHLELGSFAFAYDRPSMLFEDLRPQVAAQRGEAVAGNTEMSHFFNMFPTRELASDIFSVVEDARIDFGLTNKYRGLRPDYLKVQANSLSARQDIRELPVRAAMVELLIRLSLHQLKEVPVPSRFVAEARAIAAHLRRVQHPDAIVEDAAEATIRIYAIISRLPNEQVPPEDWENQDFDEDTPQEEEATDQVLQQFQAGGEGPEDDGYESPEGVDYRGEFKPELVQMLGRMRGQGGAEEDQQQAMQEISQEMLEELLRESDMDIDDDMDVSAMANSMMKEVAANQQPKTKGQGYSDIEHQDEEGGSLEPVTPRSYVYHEWDFRANDYRPRWCIVQEKQALTGERKFFTDTLQTYSGLMEQIRRQFEAIRPEMYRKVKHLPEGEDIDFDAGLEAVTDIRNKRTPDERLYWRRNKAERDVGVVFLLDMSASTAEAVDEARKDGPDGDVPSDPVAYTMWLRTRRGDPSARRTYKRIIDVEKESMVLLMNALEMIGDRYGVYGFSGFGRENVEFYVIKELQEQLTDRVKRRLDKVAPLHATRMGPAIRHAASKLEKLDAKTKFLFVVSDGRPQDRGYSREGVEKEYAVQDTRMALLEARAKDITPFALTVDRNGHDYLRTMAGDMGYEVLPDIMDLPRRLPALYRRLTV
ncbi:MAG: hypothetical protein FJ318_03735 [SAR202 cluster bacterium]|nr:hypothetical protein [SAR202 cluster bacterium]